MNKESVDTLLQDISNEFSSIVSGYNAVFNSLGADEKQKVENFEPYGLNGFGYHMFSVDNDGITLRTVRSGERLGFYLNFLPADWKKRKRYGIASYWCEEKYQSYNLDISLVEEAGCYYLEESKSMWDSQLGDYRYIDKEKSRCFSVEEIEEKFVFNEKTNNANL